VHNLRKPVAAKQLLQQAAVTNVAMYDGDVAAAQQQLLSLLLDLGAVECRVEVIKAYDKCVWLRCEGFGCVEPYETCCSSNQHAFGR
jgi:hypothetical protein